MRGIPTFPQLRRLREINLNRTYHLLQKPDILICYQHKLLSAQTCELKRSGATRRRTKEKTDILIV